VTEKTLKVQRSISPNSCHTRNYW